MEDWERDEELSRMMWITSPIEHRRQDSLFREQMNGSTIETMFGEMEVIVSPQPPLHVWVCDFCNGDILIRDWVFFGRPGGVWPVPCVGSYALCVDCMNDVMRSLEISVWPGNACGCPPCVEAVELFMALTTDDWKRRLADAVVSGSR